MTIKFPDFQVLVSRSEQASRIIREGNKPGAAGKMAPQVSQEFASREKRVDQTRKKEKMRERNEQRQSKRDDKEQTQKKKRQVRGRRIDLKA